MSEEFHDEDCFLSLFKADTRPQNIFAQQVNPVRPRQGLQKHQTQSDSGWSRNRHANDKRHTKHKEIKTVPTEKEIQNLLYSKSLPTDMYEGI